MASAEIVAIGSELLTPDRADTNSLWLTQQLNDIGIDVKMKTIVGDDVARLQETLSDAFRRSDIVLTTGGLGPTEDDITRTCVAHALGRDLVYKDDIEAHLRERFRAWGREMPEINKRQAYVVDRCEVLPNSNGSAVGMLVAEGAKILAILPGPPRENQPMFIDHVLPRLRAMAGDVHIRRRILRVAGVGESAVDEIAAPIYTSYPDVETSILFNRAEVELHVTARAHSDEKAGEIADEVVARLSEALGTAVFSTDGSTIEEVVGQQLARLGHTLSIAESCTGGLIAQRITEVPGSSDYFMEGAVTYSNEAKVRQLTVPRDVIEDRGAVSAECAEAMAAGMLRRSGTDHAISATGIAGPGGGSDTKPVGTVFIGYASVEKARSIKVLLPGDRYLIRWRASQAALDLLRRELAKLGSENR
jgi:nicotinamide-nucleotide amidase